MKRVALDFLILFVLLPACIGCTLEDDEMADPVTPCVASVGHEHAYQGVWTYDGRRYENELLAFIEMEAGPGSIATSYLPLDRLIADKLGISSDSVIYVRTTDSDVDTENLPYYAFISYTGYSADSKYFDIMEGISKSEFGIYRGGLEYGNLNAELQSGSMVQTDGGLSVSLKIKKINLNGKPIIDLSDDIITMRFVSTKQIK